MNLCVLKVTLNKIVLVFLPSHYNHERRLDVGDIFCWAILTAGIIINGSFNLSSLHSVLDIQNQNRNSKTQNGQKLIEHWLKKEISRFSHLTM